MNLCHLISAVDQPRQDRSSGGQDQDRDVHVEGEDGQDGGGPHALL